MARCAAFGVCALLAGSAAFGQNAILRGQVTDASGAKVIAAASTTQKTVREGLKTTGNVDAAKAVGRAIAERTKAAGVSKVAFDRAGFQFHGRIKALADAAREAGLEI